MTEEIDESLAQNDMATLREVQLDHVNLQKNCVYVPNTPKNLFKEKKDKHLTLDDFINRISSVFNASSHSSFKSKSEAIIIDDSITK